MVDARCRQSTMAARRIAELLAVLTVVLAVVSVLLTPMLAHADENGGIFVKDGADALSASTEDYVKTANEKWEKDADLPAQLLVVTADHVPDGQSIEEWSMSLAEKHKPGDKDKDTGLVYVVAVDDHQDRLEVGYGLEDEIPDAKASDLIKQAEAEYKQGDYDAGVRVLVDSIGTQLYGAAWTPSTDDTSNTCSGVGSMEHTSVDRAIIAVSVFLVLVFVAVLFFRRSGSSDGAGSCTGSSHRRHDDEDCHWPSSVSPTFISFGNGSSESSWSSGSSSSSSSFGGGGFGGGGASGSW